MVLRAHARGLFDAREVVVEHSLAAFAHSSAPQSEARERMRGVVADAADGDDDDDDDDDARTINALKWSGYGLRALPSAREFAHVTVLNVSSNALVSLDGLNALPRLRALDASNNRLVDLRGAHQCSELREIDCSANAIRDVRGLGVSCAKLRTFKASRNAFASDVVFDDFPALRELDLSHNCLGEGLPDLRACVGLVSVNVAGNAITTLRFAERLLPATTTHLDVSENDVVNVEEFRHLRHFPRLESLMFTGNPLEARAEHYGYDARAVALFCAPRLRAVNGAAAAAAAWALASKRLFLNDQGVLCDDLLAMLNEDVSPWVLGGYLRHVCGVEGGDRPKLATRAAAPSACSMFTVSTFVPLDDARSVTSTDDDVPDVRATFVVDSSRVYDDDDDDDDNDVRRVATSPKEALNSTAHWLSRHSDSSDDESSSLLDEEDDDGRDFSFDSLRMISPVRAFTPQESTTSDEDDFATPLERATTPSSGAREMSPSRSIEFHSLAEDLTRVDDEDDDDDGDVYSDARASSSASAPERERQRDPTPGTMRLLRSTTDSFDNSPDLRPRITHRDGAHGSFMFSDDSKSFARDEIDGDSDEDEDDSRSTEAASPSLPTPRRAFIQRAVSELTRDGPTPERLAMTAKKIEGMISSLKESRARGDDDDVG